MAPSLYWLLKIAEWIWHCRLVLLAVWAWFIWAKGVVQYLVVAAISELVVKLEALDVSAFQEIDVFAIHGAEVINAVMPLTEVVTMAVAYYTAWGTVILVRWIKSCIPTASN